MSNDLVGHLALGVLLAVLSTVLSVLVVKGKYGMLLLGVLVRPCWIVGAIRLGKPDSPWARAFYDPARLDAAARRFPSRPRPPDRPEPLAAPAPRPVRVALALLLTGVGLTLTTGTAGLVAGPVFVLARFVLVGVTWARTTVLALSAVAVATSVLPPPDSSISIVLLVTQTLLVAAGTVLLLRTRGSDPVESLRELGTRTSEADGGLTGSRTEPIRNSAACGTVGPGEV